MQLEKSLASPEVARPLVLPIVIHSRSINRGLRKEILHTSTGISTLTASRIYAVTYFIQESNNGQPPRLMRQVNGQSAVPVADNIIGLKFTYDVCDGTNPNVCAAVNDPIGGGYSPNNIYKVNIQIMGQSIALSGKSQSMVLSTEVSTQNLSFTNRYK